VTADPNALTALDFIVEAWVVILLAAAPSLGLLIARSVRTHLANRVKIVATTGLQMFEDACNIGTYVELDFHNHGASTVTIQDWVLHLRDGSTRILPEVSTTRFSSSLPCHVGARSTVRFHFVQSVLLSQLTAEQLTTAHVGGTA